MFAKKALTVLLVAALFSGFAPAVSAGAVAKAKPPIAVAADLGRVSPDDYRVFEHERISITSFSDEGLDSDGDGRFEYLKVTMSALVESGGYFNIMATLVSSDGTRLGWIVYQMLRLDVGENLVGLWFDGAYIGRTGRHGPYILRSLTISPFSDYDPWAGISLVDAYQTYAYRSASFREGIDYPPLADFTAVMTGLAVSVDASTSSDDFPISAYRWDFGDESTATGLTAEHTYLAAGTYAITLTVTDTAGQPGSVTKEVTVSTPPPPTTPPPTTPPPTTPPPTTEPPTTPTPTTPPPTTPPPTTEPPTTPTPTTPPPTTEPPTTPTPTTPPPTTEPPTTPTPTTPPPTTPTPRTEPPTTPTPTTPPPPSPPVTTPPPTTPPPTTPPPTTPPPTTPPPTSPPVTTPPPTAPGPVSGITVAFPRKKYALVSWNAPTGATSYRVRLSKKNSTKKFSAWKTARAPRYQFSGLTKNGRYLVQIVARNSVGSSPVSSLRFRQAK